jgi:hypothetical protein
MVASVMARTSAHCAASTLNSAAMLASELASLALAVEAAEAAASGRSDCCL